MYRCLAALAFAPGRRDGETPAIRSDEGEFMRRTRALFLAVLLALTVSVPVSAATTFSAKAIIRENFERAASNEPCVFDEVNETLTCTGVGNAGRFGRLTSVAVWTDAGVTRTLTFEDGSTLVLFEEYPEPTFPGNSTNAPGALVSFGNPYSAEGTWRIIGATDSLAGASGTGDVIQMGAGNTLNFWYTGSITLP